MPRDHGREGLKRLLLLGSGLLLLAAPAMADTTFRLAWDPNSEPDVAGYRLRYGTSAGNYGQSVDVGNVTDYDVRGLDAGTTYFFVVVAYDWAGNVSAPSNEVSGVPVLIIGPSPTVTGAAVTAASSIFIMQSGRHGVEVTGTNFQTGAGIDLGTGVTAGPGSVSGTTQLSATIDVAPAALLGPRALAVINPDGGRGSLAGALTVVRHADINRDCLVDGADLNLMARSFSSLAGDPAYDAAADLSGDGGVDGIDLTIFSDYFGRPLAVCP